MHDIVFHYVSVHNDIFYRIEDRINGLYSISGFPGWKV